jgi:hypothetical protein
MQHPEQAATAFEPCVQPLSGAGHVTRGLRADRRTSADHRPNAKREEHQ